MANFTPRFTGSPEQVSTTIADVFVEISARNDQLRAKLAETEGLIKNSTRRIAADPIRDVSRGFRRAAQLGLITQGLTSGVEIGNAAKMIFNQNIGVAEQGFERLRKANFLIDAGAKITEGAIELFRAPQIGDTSQITRRIRQLRGDDEGLAREALRNEIQNFRTQLFSELPAMGFETTEREVEAVNRANRLLREFTEAGTKAIAEQFRKNTDPFKVQTALGGATIAPHVIQKQGRDVDDIKRTLQSIERQLQNATLVMSQ